MAVLFIVTIATLVVDAEGIRILYEEQRAFRIGDESPLPHWIFYVIGAVVSLPYISFRAIQGWTDPENRLRAAVLAHKEHEAILSIRSNPYVQETIRAGYALDQLNKRIQETEQTVSSLKEKVRSLREDLHNLQGNPKPPKLGWFSNSRASETTSHLDELKTELQALKQRRAHLSGFPTNPVMQTSYQSTSPEQPKVGWLGRLFRHSSPGTISTNGFTPPEIVAIEEQIKQKNSELERLENEKQRHIARKDSARDVATNTSAKFWGRVKEAVEILERAQKPSTRRPLDKDAPAPKRGLLKRLLEWLFPWRR